DKEGDAGENRAGEEVGPAAAQSVPRPVAHRADDGLHEQPRYRPCEPEIREVALLGVQVSVDGTHVRLLQAPPKLYAEEPETHVPDLPAAQSRFLMHSFSLLSKELLAFSR